MSIYDEKYIKAKVKEFNGVVNINFWSDKVPKEGVHHTCIACIDSVMKMEQKNYPQVYLEECKYKIKKKKMPELIDVELESHSSSDSEWLKFFTCSNAFNVCPAWRLYLVWKLLSSVETFIQCGDYYLV